MKNTPAFVPEIMKHLNPVTEQFGKLSHDSGQMQIPETVGEVPLYIYHLLSQDEQTICDKATD